MDPFSPVPARLGPAPRDDASPSVRLSNRTDSAAPAHARKAPLFLAEPANNGWDSPTELGTTTVRVEVFVDDPDSFVARAVEAGADGRIDAVRDHQMPWGRHRQGGFVDPFGHRWLVGDRSPLLPHPPSPG